jgi:hypothetical protein
MHRTGLTIYAFIGIVLFPSLSFGTLGMREDSVRKDAEAFGSKTEVNVADNYKVYTFSAQGADFKECVSNAGYVFALSWNHALKRPRFDQLLGPHFKAFDENDPATTVNRKAGRTTHVVKTADFEVHAGGHQRSLRGYAVFQKYIPTPGDELRCLQ